MTETKAHLEAIIGQERLADISTTCDDDNLSLTNSKDIFCECKTLILKANQAKLILTTEFMLKLEKDLITLQPGDNCYFKNFVKGCYWLVDDMYKFEQIGYTKEINAESLAKLANAAKSDPAKPESSDNQQKSTSAPNNLRYLLCADCNLCPLGWYDSETKESYLHVW